MTLSDWIATGAALISAATLLTTFLRTASVQGSDRQRIKALEEAFLKLATTESVTGMGRRLDELEKEVQQVSSALTKLAVVETKLDGLDRLMTRELDEIKHTLRGFETRSFEPVAAPARRRRAVST